MPRKSAEARGTAAVVGAMTLRAPRELSAEAKVHWRRIVDSRPADFFTEGNIQLLAQYCRTLVQLDRATEIVEAMPPIGEAYAEAVQTMARLNAMSVVLATKLRLTIQSALRGDYAKNNERAKPAPLLGGNVTSLRRA